MSAFRIRTGQLLLVAMIGILAMPGSAFAAKPTFHDRFSETFDTEICGVTGTSVVTVNQVITIDGDTFRTAGQVTEVFTADGGGTAVIHSAGTYSEIFTDNGDGTITLDQDYRGLPEQIRGQRGVVIRDAGVIALKVTIDLDTGDVTTEVIYQHGPHPEADSGFSVFCDAFQAALG